MRELVILRDGHCIFPWCNTDARRCDHDHIDPYVPMDEGGPPGQTRRRSSPRSAGDITGARPQDAGATDDDDDGTYEWHGPHGRSYLVTPHGTLQLPLN